MLTATRTAFLACLTLHAYTSAFLLPAVRMNSRSALAINLKHHSSATAVGAEFRKSSDLFQAVPHRVATEEITAATLKLRRADLSGPKRVDALFARGCAQEQPPTPVFSNEELPPDIPPGAFLRAGPNPRGASKTDEFFDSDGMVNCVVMPPLEKGRVERQCATYSRYWVRTSAFEKQQQDSSCVLKGALAHAPRGWSMIASILHNIVKGGQIVKDCCNTALCSVNGRVLALMEQSKPSELAVFQSGKIETIQSLSDLGGSIPDDVITGGSLSAHSKQDPESQQRMSFTYNILPPFARHDVFSENGQLLHSAKIALPAATMIHDIAITSTHSVLLDFPLNFRLERMLVDEFPLQYESTGSARIGLLPRFGNADDVQWFDVQPGVVLHTINAFNRDDGTVVVQAFRSLPDGPLAFPRKFVPSFPYEWVLDTASGICIREGYLSDTPGDFPTINPHYVGREASFACYVGVAHVGPGSQGGMEFALLDKLTKLDLRDGGAGQQFQLPEGSFFTSEPLCVPKTRAESPESSAYIQSSEAARSSSAALDEEACYVMVTATDVDGSGAVGASSLMVFDASAVDQGPVSTIPLPESLPMGLHCEWVPWAELAAEPANAHGRTAARQPSEPCL